MAYTPYMPTHPELLAPAGDWDCVQAAIENGADAIYFGLDTGFNARARATNFAVEDLPRLMSTLHRRGLKGYATLNTLVFSDELSQFAETIVAVAEAGVDAILVQDVGAARLSRSISPDLPLHASTQMTLTSAESIRLAEELGMERVVVARELSIDEIVAIRRQTSMPLEVFVHGACQVRPVTLAQGADVDDGDLRRCFAMTLPAPPTPASATAALKAGCVKVA